MYYFNNTTLNIGCRGSHPISNMTWRVSEECQSRVQIRGCRVRRGLQATFRGGGGLGAAFRGCVGWGVRVEGACSSVGDCWKGLRIRSTPKHLWNWEAVRVWRMPKVFEVRVGKTLRCFWSRKQVVPWHTLPSSQSSTPLSLLELLWMWNSLHMYTQGWLEVHVVWGQCTLSNDPECSWV